MRTWNHKKKNDLFLIILKDQTQQNSWYYTLLADHVSTLGPNLNDIADSSRWGNVILPSPIKVS